MKNPHDIIIRPVLTEKSYDEMANRTYTFIVASKANRTEIKKAVEAIFDVKVEKVNTLRQKGKTTVARTKSGYHAGNKPSFKKAYVKLTPDSKEIEFFEGMAQ